MPKTLQGSISVQDALEATQRLAKIYDSRLMISGWLS